MDYCSEMSGIALTCTLYEMHICRIFLKLGVFSVLHVAFYILCIVLVICMLSRDKQLLFTSHFTFGFKRSLFLSTSLVNEQENEFEIARLSISKPKVIHREAHGHTLVNLAFVVIMYAYLFSYALISLLALFDRHVKVAYIIEEK